MFNGMRLPDYENAKVVHFALQGKDINTCPIMKAVYEIAYGSVRDPRQVLISALRKSIDYEDVVSHEYVYPGIRNKRALVTGAGGTIGGSIVQMLVLQGARVVALDRDEEALERLRRNTGCEILVVD